MRRNLIIILLSSLLLLSQISIAAADSPSVQGTVHMNGGFAIDSNQRLPVLSLTADATDGSGWHLEAALTPRQTRGRDDGRVINLSGQFNLTRQGSPTITGQAQGQLDRFGDGSLQLAGQGGTSVFDANFSIDSVSQLQLDLSGQFPSAADPQSTTSTSAQPTNHIFWYLARATGFAAYLVLFLNICLGLGLMTRFFGPLIARWQTFDLHQFTGFLALGLTVLHALSLLGDHFIGFTVDQLLVPFASTYRPFWIALGIMSFYLLAIVIASYYVRRWIGHSTWRILHYTTFGLYFLALLHGVASGSDTEQLWANLLYWVTGAIVVGLTYWRFTNHSSERQSHVRAGSSTQTQAPAHS